MRQDEIRREIHIEAPVETVWNAITDPARVASWFGDVAEIDLRPGGKARFGWTDLDGESHAIVEVVDPPHRFTYRWDAVPGVPVEELSTTVDFQLQVSEGGTLLIMVESGFASIPDEHYEKRLAENTGGWNAELADLLDYLAAESVVG